jgi:hypothetical protein
VDHESRLRTLRTLQRLLDSAFRVPGTRIRFGWDPIIGLFPWVGDVLTALMGAAIIVHAHRVRVPRIVQLRMLFNIAVDLLIGVVPIAGDVADVFWKSNDRNMALLERHVVRPHQATLGDWVFVTAMVMTVLAVAAIPIVVVYWVLHLLGRAIV